MTFTTRTGLLGFLLALSALTASPATATGAARPTSIEARMDRIATALRAREQELGLAPQLAEDLQLAYGFVNRVGPRGFVNGPYRGAFRNAHPYYGGGGRGFVNGGGGFVNRGYGGGGFVNRPYRGGGVFRNW